MRTRTWAISGKSCSEKVKIKSPSKCEEFCAGMEDQLRRTMMKSESEQSWKSMNKRILAEMDGERKFSFLSN